MGIQLNSNSTKKIHLYENMVPEYTMDEFQALNAVIQASY